MVPILLTRMQLGRTLNRLRPVKLIPSRCRKELAVILSLGIQTAIISCCNGLPTLRRSQAFGRFPHSAGTLGKLLTTGGARRFHRTARGSLSFETPQARAAFAGSISTAVTLSAA